jgi:hypothetical protein
MTNHYDDYESYSDNSNFKIVKDEQYVDYRDHLNKILDKRTYDSEVLNNINQGDITSRGMGWGAEVSPFPQYSHLDYVPTLEINPIIDNEPNKEREFVNHPDHYNPGPYEVIKIIEHYDLGFHLGNVIKYILRAGVKNEDTYNEDLKKALWYLQRKIDNKESNNA